MSSWELLQTRRLLAVVTQTGWLEVEHDDADQELNLNDVQRLGLICHGRIWLSPKPFPDSQ
jgi:hypothetical protein